MAKPDFQVELSPDELESFEILESRSVSGLGLARRWLRLSLRRVFAWVLAPEVRAGYDLRLERLESDLLSELQKEKAKSQAWRAKYEAGVLEREAMTAMYARLMAVVQCETAAKMGELRNHLGSERNDRI